MLILELQDAGFKGGGERSKGVMIDNTALSRTKQCIVPLLISYHQLSSERNRLEM